MAAVDPGALYTQTLADLGLQTSWQESGLNEKLGEAESRNTWAEGQLTQQEPGVYKAESNRANKGGILTSGINTARKTTIANTFAGKRAANQLTLATAHKEYGTFNPITGKIEGGHAREGVQLKETEGKHKAGEVKAGREDEATARNPVVPTAGPTPLGVAPGLGAPTAANPGGVPQSPYGGPMTPAPGGGWQYRGPNGTWVRVGGTARRQ